MRWFRPRPQKLVLRTVQLRVALVDDSGATTVEGPAPVEAPPPAAGPRAPPLAVRPVEDPTWVMVN